MDIYLRLIDVITPVFALIGIGYYLGKKKPNYDTEFITFFAAKFGSPGIAFYAITSSGISFSLFVNYFANIRSLSLPSAILLCDWLIKNFDNRGLIFY